MDPTQHPLDDNEPFSSIGSLDSLEPKEIWINARTNVATELGVEENKKKEGRNITQEIGDKLALSLGHVTNHFPFFSILSFIFHLPSYSIYHVFDIRLLPISPIPADITDLLPTYPISYRHTRSLTEHTDITNEINQLPNTPGHRPSSASM